jgi:thioredoxin-like negative regulator of GroEL
VFKILAGAALGVLLFAASGHAGENLKINPHLDYSSDSMDGPHITGDHMEDGVAAGKPNYVLIYGEGCYNSKRQSRRTVGLYEKYRGRVNFVIIDLDKGPSGAQSELVRKHYTGSIPHVVILDKNGKVLHDAAGEVSEAEISGIFEKALAQ